MKHHGIRFPEGFGKGRLQRRHQQSRTAREERRQHVAKINVTAQHITAIANPKTKLGAPGKSRAARLCASIGRPLATELTQKCSATRTGSTSLIEGADA